MQTKSETNYNVATKSGMQNSVAWLNSFVARIAQGGTWMIPRSGTIYVIDHAAKKAHKTCALLPDPSLDQVFEAAGWTVIDSTI